MISLLPNVTPKDVDGAFAVMALVANPEAAAKRLAELQDALTAANERMAAVEIEAKDVAMREGAAAGGVARLAADREAFAAAQAAWAAMSVERDAQAKFLADKLASKDADLSEMSRLLDARAEAVSAREAAVADRLADLSAGEAAVAELKAEHERLLDNARLLLGR
jgi:chromosome segregation ATPase